MTTEFLCNIIFPVNAGLFPTDYEVTPSKTDLLLVMKVNNTLEKTREKPIRF